MAKEKKNGFKNTEKALISNRISNPEFDRERQAIESLKTREEQHIITPDEFKQSTKRVATLRKMGARGDSFEFKAGRDRASGKRYFNVKGMANPKQIYRAAKFLNDDQEELYFFAENYDKLYNVNSDRIITVNAWKKVGKVWQQTPVPKASLKNGLTTITVEEASAVYNEILQQGKNPGA